MENSSWVGSQKSISVTVVGAIQNIRGGRSVTHDPPIAKKVKTNQYGLHSSSFILSGCCILILLG